MASSKQTSSFNDIIQSSTPVLIDFYAEWCGPCKAFAPQLAAFKNEIGDKARIIKIDVDKNQGIAGKLQVRSIPTVMIFQNGELKYREAGVRPIAELRNIIDQLNANA